MLCLTIRAGYHILVNSQPAKRIIFKSLLIMKEHDSFDCDVWLGTRECSRIEHRSSIGTVAHRSSGIPQCQASGHVLLSIHQALKLFLSKA